jgi:hypothetical protein
MSLANVTENDPIIFFDDIKEHQEYEAVVLGVERSEGYVWAIVPKLKEVFEFNLINILPGDGKNLFYVYDRRRSIDSVINDNNWVRMFKSAENEEDLLKKVKKWKLILP